MSQFERVPPDVLEKLKGVSTATASGTLLKMGIRTTFMEGVFPLCPELKMAGQAVTLRFLPKREDLELPPEQMAQRPQRRAIEAVGPGDVLVVEARGDLGGGTAGDILVTRVRYRGGVGYVTDGALRDTPYLKTMGFPIYVRGAHGAPHTRHLIDIGVNEPIACGGVVVLPGDVLLGDGEGVVVIPLKYVQKVLEEGLERERIEIFIREQVERGAPTSEVYPPNEEYTRRYQEWLKTQK